MALIHFISHQGGRQSLDIPDGWSVMEGAVKDGIDGILGDCGGALSCATCHVHVDANWRDRLPPASADEVSMLEMAIDPGPDSRLCCQIKVGPALDGLTLTLPERQY